MRFPTVLPGRASLERLDVAIAKVAFLGSLLLLGLWLLAAEPLLLAIPLATGTGSGLYLLTGDRESIRTGTLTLPRAVVGYLPSVVLLALSALVVLVYSAGTRTVPAYLLTGLVGALIFAQILFVDEEAVAVGPILVQILAAAVAIRLSALLVTPGYVGVDIWTHATVFVDGIASDGSLVPLAESKYIMAPVYHAAGAVGALVFGNVRHGIYLSVGLVVALSSVLVYSTGRLVLPARWALLATALYAFGDQFIRWGMHVIPTSLGLVFFLATVYLVTRLFHADAELWAVALALVTALATVFTHQVATAVLLVFLGIAAFVAVVLRVADPDGGFDHGTRKAASTLCLFGTTVATTLYSWANTPFGGETFLWRELWVIRRTIAEQAGFMNLAGGSGPETIGSPAGGSVLATLVPYVELFGFALMLAVAVVGGLLLVRSQVAPDVALTHLLSAAALFVLVFGLSLFGVRALLPGRWLAFLYVPLALLGAAGVSHLSRTGSRRVVVAVFLVLALGYPSTMVVAEKATLDSPAFDDTHKRFAYTEAEIGAVETMAAVRPGPAEVAVRTDHPYYLLFERYGGYDADTLVLGPDGPVDAETTVARDYQSRGPATFDAAPNASAAAVGPPAEAVCPDDWNALYANDAVRICTAPSTEGAA